MEQVDSPKETHLNDSRFLAAGVRIAFKTISFDAMTIRVFGARNNWFVTILALDFTMRKLASLVRVPFILNDQAFAKAVIARQSGVAFNLNSRSMTIVCVENQHH